MAEIGKVVRPLASGVGADVCPTQDLQDPTVGSRRVIRGVIGLFLTSICVLHV